MWVPADAVVRRGQLTGLFVVVENELRLRWIRPGRRSGDAVEVLAGLPPGSAVVRRPGPAVLDGTAVGEVNEEPWSFTPEEVR